MVSSTLGPSSSDPESDADGWSLPPQAVTSRVRLQASATRALRGRALGRMEMLPEQRTELRALSICKSCLSFERFNRMCQGPHRHPEISTRLRQYMQPSLVTNR